LDGVRGWLLHPTRSNLFSSKERERERERGRNNTLAFTQQYFDVVVINDHEDDNDIDRAADNDHEDDVDRADHNKEKKEK
jgi:hypothetical protein